MSLDTLLILQQALVGAVKQGFDIRSPDFEKVVTAKRELDRAIEEASQSNLRKD